MLTENHHIKCIFKVKARIGIPGNDKADELANIGSDSVPIGTGPFIFYKMTNITNHDRTNKVTNTEKHHKTNRKTQRRLPEILRRIEDKKKKKNGKNELA